MEERKEEKRNEKETREREDKVAETGKGNEEKTTNQENTLDSPWLQYSCTVCTIQLTGSCLYYYNHYQKLHNLSFWRLGISYWINHSLHKSKRVNTV